MVSQTSVCPDVPQSIISPSSSTLLYSSPSECMTIQIYSSPINVSEHPIVRPVAITFIEEKESDARTPYSIIQNGKGFVVGQIVSDVIIIKRSFPSYVTPPYPISKVDICFIEALFGNTSQIDPRYTVYDLGRNFTSQYFHPENLNATMIVNGTSYTRSTLCFQQVELSENVTSFALVLRLDPYENYKLLTSAEFGILIASGSLYAVGFLTIIIFGVVVAVQRMSLFVFLVYFQSCLLTLCRCIYFFLISFYLIPIGSIVDFVLVDIPTFIYFQILIQILISFYTFAKFYESQKHTSPWAVWLTTLALWLLVWLLFSAIAIAVSTVDSSGDITYTCQCRLATIEQPTGAARYIRIGYKSVLIVLSLIVFVAMASLAKKDYSQRRTESILNYILMISACLSANCLAFVIYYAVDQPTPFFAIVLWFTELIPILFLCFLLAFPNMKYLRTHAGTIIASRLA